VPDVFLASRAVVEDHQVPGETSHLHPQPELEGIPGTTRVQALSFAARIWLGVAFALAAAVLTNAAIFWSSPDL